MMHFMKIIFDTIKIAGGNEKSKPTNAHSKRHRTPPLRHNERKNPLHLEQLSNSDTAANIYSTSRSCLLKSGPTIDNEKIYCLISFHYWLVAVCRHIHRNLARIIIQDGRIC